MTYLEILTNINLLKPTSDVQELVQAIAKLTDAEEKYSAEDALYRASHKMTDYQRNYLAAQYGKVH